MMDLIKLGDKTYCIKSPANVGIYLIDDRNVCLIDTGNSRDFGKAIDKILMKNNWNLKYIINTHSHADHIGGNKYLQEKYNCKIYANRVESYFINEPSLEPALLYGAFPLKELYIQNLFAEKSKCEDIEDFYENGLEIINLEGHSFGLIGVVTSDNVCFVGDACTSDRILSKYPIQYIYDVDEYLKTIDYLISTNYRVYVPSHGEIENDSKNTFLVNKKVVLEIANQIVELVGENISFSDLLKKIFELHHISMNVVQYHLISVTVKAFLTKLVNDNKIEIYFENNIMMLKKI